MSTETHEHTFNTYDYERIMEVKNEKYTGDVGATALVYRVCACGKKEAFEFGKWREMEELYKQLSKTDE